MSICFLMFMSIWSIGMWPGPSTMTCVPFFQPRSVSSPSTFSSANWASSLASAMRAGPQAVAQAPGHVVLAHDVAQVVEVRVERVLLAVGHHPLGDQRAAAADDAGDAAHRQRAGAPASRRSGRSCNRRPAWPGARPCRGSAAAACPRCCRPALPASGRSARCRSARARRR